MTPRRLGLREDLLPVLGPLHSEARDGRGSGFRQRFSNRLLPSTFLYSLRKPERTGSRRSMRELFDRPLRRLQRIRTFDTEARGDCTVRLERQIGIDQQWKVVDDFGQAVEVGGVGDAFNRRELDDVRELLPQSMITRTVYSLRS